MRRPGLYESPLERIHDGFATGLGCVSQPKCLGAAVKRHILVSSTYAQLHGGQHRNDSQQSFCIARCCKLFVPELLRVLVGILPNAAAGKLVTVTGTVVRATGTQPLITGMGFACGACGEEQAGHFVDGVYAPPGRCPTDGCRGKTFAPNRASATSVDWRSLKLQVRGLLGVSRGFWTPPASALLVRHQHRRAPPTAAGSGSPAHACSCLLEDAKRGLATPGSAGV